MDSAAHTHMADHAAHALSMRSASSNRDTMRILRGKGGLLPPERPNWSSYIAGPGKDHEGPPFTVVVLLLAAQAERTGVGEQAQHGNGAAADSPVRG